MSTPSVDQLKRAIAIKEQINSLEAELASILGGTAIAVTATATPIAKRKYTKKATAVAAPAPAEGKKRTMSPEGRARIIAAQKARWAKSKKEKKS